MGNKLSNKAGSKTNTGKEKLLAAASKKTSDKRLAGERIPIQLLVDYKAEGSYLFDFCRDLGEGGVFIETSTPKNQGEVLELTFTIPDSKETLCTKGKVIWVQGPVANRSDLRPGMGIQFESFSHDDRKILEAFVKRYSLKKSA